jgi:16S rRNA (guanine966-N2)-methyltransferase
MGKIRIIGGIYRSRILKFSDDVSGLRPTPDRVRQTVFNWLEQDLTGLTCLDLFAGSGALGFEAASRNAKKVVLNDMNQKTLIELSKNRIMLGADNVIISSLSAETCLKKCTEKFDVIFLDPPYNSNLLNKSLRQINELSILLSNAKIYIEYQKQPDLTGYEILKHKKVGSVNFALLRPLIE